MSEEASPTVNRLRKESVIDLDPKTRAIERVRLVNEMRVVNVGMTADPAWPVELVGNSQQAVAFVDLIYSSTPHDRLGLVIVGPIPGLKGEPSLAQELNKNGGLLPVKGGTCETTVVCLSHDQATGQYHCKFGHSAKGSSIKRGYGKGVDVDINNNPEIVVEESLYRLYRLTGNPNFTEILGMRVELKGKGVAQATSKAMDPEGHYATLGLNPYVLRFMSEETFEAAVRGIKREISKKLHPDVAQPSKEEEEYLKKMFTACNVLEDKDSRDQYSEWLKL